MVVTGAGSGFGFAIATLFARLGADVAILGRNEDRLAKAKELLRRVSARGSTRRPQYPRSRTLHGLYRQRLARARRLDALINNAGGQFPQMALDFKPKGWKAVIDNNLNGTWYMMQAAAKAWVERNIPGSIVNIVADFWRGMPGIAHTAAARAGVTYLSKSVAVEWAPLGIRVNCIAPGVLETSGFAHYPPEGLKTYGEANPMKKPGDVWDIAEASSTLPRPRPNSSPAKYSRSTEASNAGAIPGPPAAPTFQARLIRSRIGQGRRLGAMVVEPRRRLRA